MPSYNRYQVPKGRQDKRATAVVPDEEKRMILIVQNGMCFYCGYPFPQHDSDFNLGFMDYVMDHFVPRSKRGKNRAVNRVAAHSYCDMMKGSRMPTKDEVKRKRIHNLVLGWER